MFQTCCAVRHICFKSYCVALRGSILRVQIGRKIAPRRGPGRSRELPGAGVRASATTLCCRSPGLPPRERRLHTADSVRGYFGSDRAGSWAADAARLLFTGAIGTAHFSSGATGTALFILNCQAFLIVGLPRRLDARKDSRQVRGLPAIH